ncbi:MAG: hypothetical protein ACU0DK_11480 [Pseudooceanicola sp.]
MSAQTETALDLPQRLDHAAQLPGLPPAAMRMARAFAERLRRPVRICVLGMPGAGKSELISAILDEALIPRGLQLPTHEIAHGPVARVIMTLEDGSTLDRIGLPDAGMLRANPVFLRIEAPLPALRDRSYMVLVAPASEPAMAPALAWAARRCDIAIWCARGWSDLDQRVWKAAPDSLKAHALLVATGDAGATGPDAEEVGFESAFSVDVSATGRGPGEPDDRLNTLTAHVDAIIRDGRTEDRDAALMLLRRYAKDEADQPAEAVTASAEGSPSTVGEEAVAAEVTPEARAMLERLFHTLRKRGEALLDRVEAGATDEEDAARILSEVEETFASLQSLIDTEDTFGDAWPDLREAVTEAHEMALLLRVEGGVDQAGEAAALLLQLRRETEWKLAA